MTDHLHDRIAHFEGGAWHLRQSALQAFLECRRKFYWEYVKGVEPIYPDGPRPWRTADTGTAFHKMIGAWYEGTDPNAALDSWLSEEWPTGLPDKHGVDLAEIMFEGHIDDLADDGADVGEVTIAVEKRVEARVVDVYDGQDVVLHGQVDRLVESERHGRVIDDWKSTDRLHPAMDHIQQLGRYALLLRSSEGWHADTLRTTQVKRVKRTGEGPFYSRPHVPLSEEAYRAHAISLRESLADMLQCLNHDKGWYETVTGECSWKCRVDSICVAQQHGDDPEMIVELHYRKKVG